jgi:hypothetical protein
MSTITINAFNHREWSLYGLDSIQDMDCVEYVNQGDDYGDSLRGDWFEVLEQTVSRDGVTFRVIIHGTFANDHSPGASCYTWANLYDMADADEMAEFAADCLRWESFPEYLPSDDDELDEDMDDDDESSDE